MVFTSSSRSETFEIGRQYGEKACPGEVYALNGDRGAGKTVFVKGFAAGLGVDEPVSSPTFTIQQVYDGGRLTLNHFDVYRIEDPDEMYEIGFEETLEGDGVSLIEWADMVGELLPEGTIRVTISRRPDGGEDDRLITVEGK